jgi:hypothetical protein
MAIAYSDNSLLDYRDLEEFTLSVGPLGYHAIGTRNIHLHAFVCLTQHRQALPHTHTTHRQALPHTHTTHRQKKNTHTPSYDLALRVCQVLDRSRITCRCRQRCIPLGHTATQPHTQPHSHTHSHTATHTEMFFLHKETKQC